LSEQDEAFLDWLDSDAGRALCGTRKGMTLIHELAIDAAIAVKRAEEAELGKEVSDRSS
jgi:hypothetical protein